MNRVHDKGIKMATEDKSDSPMNWRRSIRELQSDLRCGRTSVTEVVTESLLRSETDSSNAVLSVPRDRALSSARKWDELVSKNPEVAFSSYPLLGVTLGVKDVICVEGTLTTAGSKILENYRAPYTATAVERLEQAGAIVTSKLNCDEFAMGSANENSAYGPVRHPTHRDHAPGGSSGGSAAAVALDLCHLALGSDTGGSIRLPASFCGVTGIKPTYGRVSRYGLIAFASSLDQVGPMSWSLSDAALALDIMSGFDPRDSTSLQCEPLQLRSMGGHLGERPLEGMRVGIPREYWGDGIQSEIHEQLRVAKDVLHNAGAVFCDVSLPMTQYAVSVYYILAPCEAASNLSRYDGVRYGARPLRAEDARRPGEFYESVRSLFGPEVKRRILLGTFALSSGYYDAYYLRASQVRSLIIHEFKNVFNSVDVLLTPTAPTTAFRKGACQEDPVQAYLSDVMTIPASLAGLPGMSVPFGFDSVGLPIGLQILAPPLREDSMLQCGLVLESSRESKGC